MPGDTDRMPGTLASRTRDRMAALRLDVAAVVGLSGLSKNTVYRILREEKYNPGSDIVTRLAAALSCDIAILLGTASNAAPRQATPVTMSEAADVRAYRTPLPESSAPQVRHDLSPPVPSDPRLAGQPMLAVPIADDQLMGHTPPVPPGYIAFVAAAGPGLPDLPLETGTMCLVHRADTDGKIQTTFRLLTVYPDSYEFALMSPDRVRNARERIVVRKDELGAGQVKVAGIFFAATLVL